MPVNYAALRRILARATLAVALALAAVLIGGAGASTGDVMLVGNQSVAGNNDFGTAGVAQAFPTTASGSGQVTVLDVYVSSAASAVSLSAGIYADASGHPGTLLAQGVAAVSRAAWVPVQLGSPATVAAGKTYWIAVVGPSGGGKLALRDVNNGGASETSAQTSLTSLPSAWSTGSTSSDGQLAAYGVGAPGDTLAPSTPANLAVSSASQTSVTLSWSASTDNVGVTGYDVVLDGSGLAQTTSTSFTVSGLTCGTTHTFAVDAYDASGNVSGKGSVSGSTSACTIADTQVPSAPSGLKATGATASSVSLGWTGSTDNVGVAGYGVYKDGILVARTSAVTQTVSGLSCGTTHAFAVDAYDAAGNHSAKASINSSTSACASSNTIRVRAGGGAYVDSNGNTWSPDCCNSGGNVYSTTAAIAGTTDPALYQSERWNAGPFTYTFSNLAAGAFQVTLKFAEIAYLGPGKRQFNVAINGTQVLTNLDVAAQVGFNKGLDKMFTTTVGSTGQLTVAFTRGAADNPIVSDVQIVPASADTQAPTTPAGLATTGSTTSSVSLGWTASTDNVGVAGYGVYVDGVLAGTTASTNYAAAGLSCGTSHTFAVDAFDSAGNRSGKASVSGSTTACATSGDPSGQPLPVGNISGWRQIYTDNFANVSVPLGTTCGDANGFPHKLSNWDAYPYPWKGTPTWGTYCPERTTSIHDGMMDIWLHSESVGGTMMHLIDAPYPKIAGYPNGNGQRYGRYVIRYQEPTSFKMFHVSWLLWPNSNTWPRDGEIDFPEADTSSATTSGFMHWQNATSGSQQDAYSIAVPLYGAWHTAVIEWLPSRVTLTLDGKVVGNSTDSTKIPNTAMHWIIQNGGSYGVSTPDNISQGHIYVDWVAIYAPA